LTVLSLQTSASAALMLPEPAMSLGKNAANGPNTGWMLASASDCHLYDPQVLVVDGHGAQHLAVCRIDVPQADLRIIRARQQVPLPEAAPRQAVALQTCSTDVCVLACMYTNNFSAHSETGQFAVLGFYKQVWGSMHETALPWSECRRLICMDFRFHRYLRLVAGEPDVG
jgi:hypothetical protein